MNPSRENEEAYLRFTINRNRQNEGACSRYRRNRNRQLRYENDASEEV